MKFNLIKRTSKIISSSTTSGITLVEALLAAAFSVFVISGATFGVMTMMQANVRLEERSQTRVNLDRALNYIADEIKIANDVAIVDPSSSFPGSGTGVLFLTIPITPTNSDPNRVYFIRSSTDTWRGPNTINRVSGTFGNPVAAASGNVLIDGVTEPDDSELTRIQDLCDTDLQGADGFYACIDEDTNTVDFYLYGKIKENDNTESTFPLSRRVSTRATAP